MSCGKKGMVRDENRTEVISHNGETITVAGLSGWFCPFCNDGWFDDESSVRFSAAGDALVLQARERKREEVRRIRKKLRLSQKEAAAIFGGGPNAFSLYERGKVEPHTSTQKLLRLLDRHPELMNEVKSH
jgi:HTH-type transcriptional regulator/antitoxin MqsA